MNEFAELYKSAKVWTDMDKAIETLSDHAQIELMNCLRVVKENTGLDMRQDFLLGLLKSRTKWNDYNAKRDADKKAMAEIRDHFGI